MGARHGSSESGRSEHLHAQTVRQNSLTFTFRAGRSTPHLDHAGEGVKWSYT